jgi:hypothetical protein
MELKRNHFILPSLDDITPRVRYSLNQQTNKQRSNASKFNRLSLNHGITNNNQVLLRNRRQVCMHF